VRAVFFFLLCRGIFVKGEQAKKMQSAAAAATGVARRTEDERRAASF
jgi:hypothetical protein